MADGFQAASPRSVPNQIVEEHRLCIGCRQMLDDTILLNRAESSTSLVNSIRDSVCVRNYDSQSSLYWLATSGCHLCSLAVSMYLQSRSIKGNLAERYGKLSKRNASISVYVTARKTLPWVFTFTGPVTIELEGQDGSNSNDTHILNAQFIMVILAEGKKQRYLESVGLTASTGSDHCLRLQKSWLATCLEDHESCSNWRQPAMGFPSRLIFVGCSADSPSRLRLCNRSAFGDGVQYLTLSHCWGKSESLQLTLEREQSLLRGFEMESLPKTLRDAVDITRRLSYQYLWVDSLCIMQDSSEDWKREAAAMGTIYSHSVCTIAALHSRDNTEGCFTDRDPLAFRDLIYQSSNNGTWLIRPMWLREDPPFKYMETTSAQLNQPLLRRAWVLQERILSPRILYYGAEQVFWECSESHSSEIEPRLIPNGSYGEPGSNRSLKMNWMALLRIAYDGVDSNKFWCAWAEVVQEYSCRYLTYDSDKLVAIAGLINLIESAQRATNIAGFWVGARLTQLLWHTRNSPPRLQIDVPSWSWASVPGEIFWDSIFWGYGRGTEGTECLYHVEMLQLLFTNHESEEGILGRKCEELTLFAPISHLELSEGREPPGPVGVVKYMLCNGNPIEVWVWPDDSEDQRWPQLRHMEYSKPHDSDAADLAITPLWLLLVCTERQQRISAEPPSEAECRHRDLGLILQPCGANLSRWSRIGMFEISHKNSDFDPCHLKPSLLENEGQSLLFRALKSLQPMGGRAAVCPVRPRGYSLRCSLERRLANMVLIGYVENLKAETSGTQLY